MIVNSDNNCFPIDQWINSKTYGLDNQEKLIFVDNRTDQFNNVSNEKKKIWRKMKEILVWWCQNLKNRLRRAKLDKTGVFQSKFLEFRSKSRPRGAIFGGIHFF